MGLAFLDPSRRLLGCCEFADDEHFCHLETALVQLGPKECVLPKVRGGVGCLIDGVIWA